ncbi:MAG: hypothetical protein IK025_09440 [Bacteroidales bacterium]|nr:hypothetical protein [Bacteroidales bacterium]
MRKLLSVICIVLFSVGIIFAQTTVTKKAASNSGSNGTTTTTSTAKSSSSNSNGDNNGSTATKGEPSTSQTGTTSTNSSSSSTSYRSTTDAPTTDTTITAKTSDFTLDHFIIGGGINAGATVSSNIVGTGAMIGLEFEVMVQFKHHRLGIGGDKELMLTLENLGTVIGTWGKSNCNLNKVYFTYEWTLFKRSPINFTAGLKVGSFDVGKSAAKDDGTANTKTPFFGAVGICLEVGHPRFLLYIKPEIGYNSYDTGSWKKDIYAMATIGFRWKSKRLDKYPSLNTTTTESGKKYE